MPELPEVETTRRGIAPALENHRIEALIVRERRLRWPVPAGLELKLHGQPVTSFSRRAKYLLLETPAGTAMIHLGMSGRMLVSGAALGAFASDAAGATLAESNARLRQVAEEGEYTVRVRAGISQGRLTDALRVLMFWSDDWQRQSEWYAWSLPR